MTSLQEPGRMDVYVRAPSGARKLIKSASTAWWSPGGAPDGVPTNTPEKWNFLQLSPHRGGPGYFIDFEVTCPAVDGIDASDCSFQIPVIVNGNQEILGNSAHAAGLGSNAFSVDLTFADYTTVANQTVKIYSVRAKEGVVFQVGGDRVNAAIEDDTA